MSLSMNHMPAIGAQLLYEDGVSLMMLEQRLKSATSFDIALALIKLNWQLESLTALALVPLFVLIQSQSSTHFDRLWIELAGLFLHQGTTTNLIRHLLLHRRSTHLSSSSGSFGLRIRTIVCTSRLLWICLLAFAQQLSLLIENQASAVLVVGNKRPAVQSVDELAARRDLQPYFMWQNSMTDKFRTGPASHRAIWIRVHEQHLIKFKYSEMMKKLPILLDPNCVFVAYQSHLRVLKQMFCYHHHESIRSSTMHLSKMELRTFLGMLMRRHIQRWKRRMFESRSVHDFRLVLSGYQFLTFIPSFRCFVRPYWTGRRFFRSACFFPFLSHDLFGLWPLQKERN